MGSNICQAENRNSALFIDPDRKQNITEHPDEMSNTEFNDGTEADQDKNPLSSFISAHCNKIPIYASNRLQFQSLKKLQGQSAADKQESSKRKSRLQLKVTAVKRSPRVNQLFQFQSTLRQFIVSKKIEDNSFGRIEINQQKFIFLRKEAIRNHYKMQQEVGEGSYGSVYKAFCLKTTEVRAVKCIKKENFNNSKMYQVFAELQLLKKLDHPNIIKLYEVFEWEGHYQIVTQFCNGGSIIDFIKSRKHLNEEIIRSILKQLLCCLNYLHTLKIVHRDLKLQNVMFIHQLNDTSKSNQVEVKLLDFGSAFKMDKPSIKCTQLVGTISYMPPQIIKGYFTDKCDVWSCGVIFYILLTSKSPFKCKQKEGTLQKILTHQIRLSDKIWSKVTKNAKDLISKMLEKDPFKRISADEALNHPWFKDNIEVMECKTSVFLNDLSFYYRQNNLISVLQSYLTFTKITQQERKNISECFKQIDKNNDGFIQREELIEAYKSHSKSDFNAEEVDFILRKLDKDNSNSINFNEFAAAVATKQKLWAKGALEEAFDYFDTDKTKYIERDELASIIEGSDSHQIEELLRQMDEDGDQKISKNEFINYFLKKGCLH